MKAPELKPWASLSWPNRITIVRLLLIPPFLLLLLNLEVWAYGRWAALAIFAVMAMSDLTDGLLARKLNQRTRLGAILDPLADKALIICSVVLLSLPGSAIPGARLSNWIVVAVVGKDLWVIVGFIVVYLVTDRFRVQPSLAGKAATAGQLLMVGLVLIAPDLNRAREGLGSQLVVAASWLVAGLSVAAVIAYTRLGLRFVAEGQEPLDAGGRDSRRL